MVVIRCLPVLQSSSIATTFFSPDSLLCSQWCLGSNFLINMIKAYIQRGRPCVTQLHNLPTTSQKKSIQAKHSGCRSSVQALLFFCMYLNVMCMYKRERLETCATTIILPVLTLRLLSLMMPLQRVGDTNQSCRSHNQYLECLNIYIL